MVEDPGLLEEEKDIGKELHPTFLKPTSKGSINHLLDKPFEAMEETYLIPDGFAEMHNVGEEIATCDDHDASPPSAMPTMVGGEALDLPLDPQGSSQDDPSSTDHDRAQVLVIVAHLDIHPSGLKAFSSILLPSNAFGEEVHPLLSWGAQTRFPCLPKFSFLPRGGMMTSAPFFLS